MSGAAIFSYVDQFFSGGIDPSTPHRALIFLTVAGGAAVGIGIIWEAARSGHLWTIPTVFVFFGVVVEAAATVILFEFDEGISHAQQARIEVLDNRLLARSLSLDQAVDIKNSLAAYSGQTFEIIPYWKNKESRDIANRLADVLISAGWEIDQPKSFVMLAGVVTGLYVAVSKTASPRAHEAQDALVEALNRNGIAALEDVDTPDATDKISINCGIKP